MPGRVRLILGRPHAARARVDAAQCREWTWTVDVGCETWGDRRQWPGRQLSAVQTAVDLDRERQGVEKA